MRTCVHVCGLCVPEVYEGQDNFEDLDLSFHLVGHKDQIQAVRMASPYQAILLVSVTVLDQFPGPVPI